MAASCSDVVMKVCMKGLKVECFCKIISKLKLLAYHSLGTTAVCHRITFGILNVGSLGRRKTEVCKEM